MNATQIDGGLCMSYHAPKSKKLSLDVLVFSALSQLQVLQYNQRSIRRYQTVWRKLVTFAQQLRVIKIIDGFSPDFDHIR